MPSRRLVVSSSAGRRLAEAEAFLSERASAGEILILAASIESAHHLARRLATERGALFGLSRMTLDQLAYRLALPALAEAGLAPQSGLADEALAARLVHAAREKGKLGAYDTVSRWPGFPRALARTLGELRLQEIAARDLEASGLGGPLAEMLARFEEEAHGSQLADRAIVLRSAIEAAVTAEWPLGLPCLLLDLSLGHSLEARLVGALVNRAPDVFATLPSGDLRSLSALEEALGVSHELLDEGEVAPAVARVQRFVFSDTPPPKSPTDPAVWVVSAPGEAQEAVELARAIHQEAERGVAFDQMAILLHAPELYTVHVEDALDRAGIPSYFEAGTLRPDPSGRAFLALLHCAAEGLTATRFAEYLSLGQVPAAAAEGERERAWAPPRHDLAPPTPAPASRQPLQLDLFAEPEKVPAPAGTLRAPWRWEKLLVDAAVIGGRERWERRLAGLERELETRLTELDDPESPLAGTLRRQIEDLQHLESFALPVVSSLAELPERGDWGEWLDRLQALASQALAHPDGVLSLLQELRPMSRVGAVEIFEVLEVLSERLTLLSQEPPSHRYGRVWVAPIDRVRGMSFEVVLVCGLAERLFPRKIVEDPLLLDSGRRRLSRRLLVQEDRIARERLSLRLAVGAARRKLVLSYPSVDVQKARGRVPSFYLLEVKRAVEGVLPDFEALSGEAAGQRGARLGWPAPRDPLLAVDAAEHDLAFLADALRPETDLASVRGAGRYLMEVSPFLAQSLRGYYRRWDQKKFTASDGLVDASTETRRALASHLPEARSYSVTGLEQFAACPYRFYLYAIQGLRPRETAVSIIHLDPLTRGAVLHVAQFQILKTLESKGLLPVKTENLAPVLEAAESAFRQVAADFADQLAPAIERIWQDELDGISTDLRGWLRREATAEGGWVPFRYEFTFGMRPRGPADPASVLEEARLTNGLRLRGAIDLVERRADGNLRVTDYKSGKAVVPESAVLYGGRSLQRVLYPLAYEALTGETVVSGRLYYCTRKGDYLERVVAIDEQALENLAEFQRMLTQFIQDGFFPAAPFPKTDDWKDYNYGCRFCDYLPVCGPNAEELAGRKAPDPKGSPDRQLSRLNWLRSLT
jgi:hypothetical protein